MRQGGDKRCLLSQFFDSDPPEASKGLISLDEKGESDGIRRMVYDDLKTEEKSKTLDMMFDWFAEIHKSNRSHRETRIAGEDVSWFLRNGFAKEFLAAEKGLGRHLHDMMSLLCSYNAEGMALASQLKTVIESHRHVIIDHPMAVYAAPE